MRLRELTEQLVTPTVNNHEYTDPEFNKNSFDQDTDNSLPHGWFAYADDRSSDPHEIELKMHTPVEINPKQIYYMELKYLMGSNPYMPIVYDVNNYTDSQKTRSEFNMEKLLPHDQLSLGQFISAITKFIDDVGDECEYTYRLENFVDKLQNSYDSDDFSGKIKNIHKMLCNSISNIVQNPGELPHSSMFYEYAVLLSDLLINSDKKYNKHFKYDNNTDNIMYRRTSHGCQIVMADPIF